METKHLIDLLWWRNTKRIRFSFLPEKACYQNPRKHIDSFLKGIPLFAVTALLGAALLCLVRYGNLDCISISDVYDETMLKKAEIITL